MAVIALLVGGFALAATMDDDGGEAAQEPTEPTAPPADNERDDQPATTDAPTTTERARQAAGTQPLTNEEAGYSIAYPEGWKVERRGERIVDLVETATGTYLRIDWTDEPGDSPQAAWEQQERSFSKKEGYQRVQMTETTFQGHPASLWEYTYRAEGADLHAYNLGFVVGDERGFALNLQAREENWASLQDVWEQLKANFTLES